MYVKNQLLEVEIIDITNEGEGVGKIDGYTFFIKDALIGDTVSFIVTKVKKNYGYGKVKDILKRSPYRVEALCSQAKRCGGCQIQEMSYDSQLGFKRNKVLNNLTRLGGFDREMIERIMEPVIGMDGKPFRYRNKAQFPIGYNKEGDLIAGFYAGRTHAIIPVSDCLLGTMENKDIQVWVVLLPAVTRVPRLVPDIRERLVSKVVRCLCSVVCRRVVSKTLTIRSTSPLTSLPCRSLQRRRTSPRLALLSWLLPA